MNYAPTQERPASEPARCAERLTPEEKRYHEQQRAGLLQQVRAHEQMLGLDAERCPHCGRKVQR